MNILIFIPSSKHYSYSNMLPLSLYLSSTDNVTVLTYDKAMFNNKAISNSRINILYKNHTWMENDEYNIIKRIMHWRFVKKLSVDFEKYDALVCDTDVSIDGYVFSKKIPSFVLHSAMDVFNATSIITKHRYRGSRYFLYALRILEKCVGSNFLPRLAIEFQEFKFTELLVDKLFGWHAKGIRRGLGPSIGLLLSGKMFRYEYEKIGVDPKKIYITGVPQYDDYFNARKYDYGEKKENPIVFFNSSTSRPDKAMEAILSLIKDNFSNKVIIAGHPRATNAVKSFYSDIANKFDNLELLLDKRSDDINKELLLNACFIVQRHSTIGLYAMSAGIPILSYSSEFEHPFDEMYYFLN
ncbi:hypothetical protein N9832_06225, partial [Amylibacter sp.]|nr:hypothetical protein [Amylibacter sp.]